MNQLLFADDTALVSDSIEKLEMLVTEFERACYRRKLKVNAEKSKVMRVSRKLHIKMNRVEMENFQTPSKSEVQISFVFVKKPPDEPLEVDRLKRFKSRSFAAQKHVRTCELLRIFGSRTVRLTKCLGL